MTPLNLKFKETLEQTGNKNDRDDQFKDMVLILRTKQQINIRYDHKWREKLPVLLLEVKNSKRFYDKTV